MPFSAEEVKPREYMMSEEEIISVVRAGAKLGIKKIRLTGGEPLLKRNIISIVKNIKLIDGIEDL